MPINTTPSTRTMTMKGTTTTRTRTGIGIGMVRGKGTAARDDRSGTHTPRTMHQDGKPNGPRWGHGRRKRRKAPRDILDVSWAISKFFLFIFHFVATYLPKACKLSRFLILGLFGHRKQ